MRIAIVDDCLADSERLYEFIRRYEREACLRLDIDAFPSGEALLQRLDSADPPTYDIVFLDVYMQGIDGIETARRIRAHNLECLVIFVTSSTEHAVESYRVRAFDYLVKPYDYEHLRQIILLCDKTVLHKTRFIELKEGRLMVKVLLCDILYTDYFNHYIQIHTQKRVIRSYMPFAEFSKRLLPYPQFLCCYRNCIVNMDAVIAMDDKDFTVKNGAKVPMARAQRAELRQLYADYAFTKLEKSP